MIKKRKYHKRVFNFVQQVFFLLSTEGSLVITRTYQPYTLVWPPVRGLVLDPLAVYSSRTVYTLSNWQLQFDGWPLIAEGHPLGKWEPGIAFVCFGLFKTLFSSFLIFFFFCFCFSGWIPWFLNLCFSTMTVERINSYKLVIYST